MCETVPGISPFHERAVIVCMAILDRNVCAVDDRFVEMLENVLESMDYWDIAETIGWNEDVIRLRHAQAILLIRAMGVETITVSMSNIMIAALYGNYGPSQMAIERSGLKR